MGRIDAETETLLVAHPLLAKANCSHDDSKETYIAFGCKDTSVEASVDLSPTLRSLNDVEGNANGGSQVAIVYRPPIAATLSQRMRGQDDACAANVMAFEPRVARGKGGSPQETTGALTADADRGDGQPCVAFSNSAGATSLGMSRPGVPPVTTRHGDPGCVASPDVGVRRLTARECERLQGFDDDYTLIPTFRRRQRETGTEALELYSYYCQTASGRAAVEFHDGRVSATPDGPRYKALGNSMPLPVIRWRL